MARQAGRVYQHERERALRHQSDIDYVARIGRAASLAITRRAQAAMIRAFVGRADPIGPAIEIIAELRDVLLKGMLFARLRGRVRANKNSPVVPSAPTLAAARSPAYERGIKWMRNRLLMSEADLAAIEATMRVNVTRVLAGAVPGIERKLKEAVALIHRDGLHVRQGTKALRETWTKLGLNERNSFQLEAIFRTQTQLAYSAGRADFNQSPEIDRILWGYKYVTAGDTRVRDSHVGLDGVTLPKGDPFWDTNYPPNGFACRCQAIEIFQERKQVAAPDSVLVDGKPVRVGADPGFEFGPRTILPSAA